MGVILLRIHHPTILGECKGNHHLHWNSHPEMGQNVNFICQVVFVVYT
jgi:hypothetical protein